MPVLFVFKEIADFEGGGLRGVRAVHAVELDVEAVGMAEGAGLGHGRVGLAHDIAPVLDRALAFEDHDYDGAG